MKNFWTENAAQLKKSLACLTCERVLQGEIITPETLEYLNNFAKMDDRQKAGIVSTMKG